MIDLKTIRDWFVIFLILLFLPKDNPISIFDVRPQDWYGELSMQVNGHLVIIGKNSYSEGVQLGLKGGGEVISLQAGQKEGIRMPDLAQALPESVLVIQASQAQNAGPTRTAMLDSKYYFSPGPLSILTQADLYNAYLIIGLLIAGFMFLGFLIARHGVEDVPEATNK
jgi:hypothetical protein